MVRSLSRNDRPRLRRQLLRRLMATTLPRRWFLMSGPVGPQKVCLTFDDGPHPEYTPQILDILKQHSVPATFFVVGQHALANPELVQRIIDEGHDLGNHTNSHINPQ